MSVWLTIPSARPPAEANKALQCWREMGYKIALWVDDLSEIATPKRIADVTTGTAEYPGYAVAVNTLIRDIWTRDESANWFVIGGDDTYPELRKRADEIAEEVAVYFSGLASLQLRSCGCLLCKQRTKTLGVMQPTGDRYGDGQIDRICGSAWIGREFARRVNQGNGPLWPEYTHMFVDEELQEVALKYGVMWQRPDLTQLHMQWCRDSAAIDSGAHEARPPDHITHDGYTPQHWAKYEKLFKERKAAGFPGSELK